MKHINTPEEVKKALNIPLPQENKAVVEPLKTKKKYNYTKKTGRPAKTIKDLPSNWKEIVYKGSLQGKTEAEIRRDIVIARGTNSESIEKLWYALKDRDAEFLLTLNSCFILRKAWWEEQGRKSLKRRYFQDRTWYAIMKNCFGYVDRVELEHAVADETFEKYKQFTVQQLQQRLDELLPNRVAGLLT